MPGLDPPALALAATPLSVLGGVLRRPHRGCAGRVPARDGDPSPQVQNRSPFTHSRKASSESTTTRMGHRLPRPPGQLHESGPHQARSCLAVSPSTCPGRRAPCPRWIRGL